MSYGRHTKAIKEDIAKKKNATLVFKTFRTMPDQKNKIGLALSGGGYRAAAFHLGTLKKLNDLRVLQNVDIISTISGGSITGAAWCLHDGSYDSFHQQMINTLTQKSVLSFIFRSKIFIRTILFGIMFIGGVFLLSLTHLSVLTFPVLIIFFVLLFRYQFKIFPVSKVIEKAYDEFFYNRKTLKDLCKKPILAIGSSNLETGRPFTFSGIKMSDSSYLFRAEYNPKIEFCHGEFPVARAVMASSCVPFAFTPVQIDKEFFINQNDYTRIHPMLVDGGVYDNQGIQKITQPKSEYECDTIITSDAGGNFLADKKYPNAIALLIRTVDLFMYRIKTTQMVQNIYKNVGGPGKPIAYFSLGWKLSNLIPGFVNNMKNGLILKEVIDAHTFHPDWIAAPAVYEPEITQHLKKNTGFDSIAANDLTDDQWLIAFVKIKRLLSVGNCNVGHPFHRDGVKIKYHICRLIAIGM